MQHCGHCHECGTELKKVLDGEEWCPACGEYKRYRSHGWYTKGDTNCPTEPGNPPEPPALKLPPYPMTDDELQLWYELQPGPDWDRFAAEPPACPAEPGNPHNGDGNNA